MFGFEMVLCVDPSARIVSQDVNKNEEIRENYFHGRDAVAPLKPRAPKRYRESFLVPETIALLFYSLRAG